jgi:hypothetical protein
MKKTTSTKESKENVAELHSSTREPEKFKSKVKFSDDFKPTRKLIKEIEGTVVQKTTEYEVFDSTDYSRKIYTGHVSTLANNIGKHEQLIPIIVKKVTKTENYPYKYRILEGHHRWHAAQKHNSPLYFMVYEFIDDEAEKEFYTAVNVNSKKLTDRDFLKMGVMLGIPSYITIQDIMVQEDFSFNDLAALHPDLVANDKFKNMLFTITPKEIKRIHYKIQEYKDILLSNEYINSISLYGVKPRNALKAGMLRIIKHPQYDHKRMLTKMNTGKNCKIVDMMTGKSFSSAVHYVEQLEKVYNKNEKGDNILHFSRIIH